MFITSAKLILLHGDNSLDVFCPALFLDGLELDVVMLEHKLSRWV